MGSVGGLNKVILESTYEVLKNIGSIFTVLKQFHVIAEVACNSVRHERKHVNWVPESSMAFR